MSQNPSPAPQITHQGSSVATRQKQKPLTIGIAAGAEDAKYQAKYRDLKQKVKEIEADNDKLHFKVLQAKRSIQRMKLERAILYERLSAVPPSPELQDRPLPPYQSGPPPPPPPPPHQPTSRNVTSNTHHREHRDLPPTDPDQALMEYIRTNGNPRVAPGPDGRPVPVIDSQIGPGVAPASHLPPLPSPRRTSSGHDGVRHLPPLSQLPPVQQYEGSRSHSHSHASPPMHHSHTHPPIGRIRSHSSSSRSRSHQAPPQAYHPGTVHPQQYPDGLPPVQHHVMHSPPLSDRDRERPRSRHHDMNEYPGPLNDAHAHGRHQTLPPLSPRMHSSDTRASGRIHNHQRLGPGIYLNREDPHERHRELERESQRDWDRERVRERDRDRDNMHSHSRSRDVDPHIHSPHSMHRSRQPIERGDFPEHNVPSRSREEGGYYHDPPAASNYPLLSRSGTPGSGSGSGSGIGAGEGPSRPDSRTQFYEHDRARSYRLRPVNQPNEELDFVHEDGRSQSHDRTGGGGGNYAISEQSRPSIDSRKRSRNEMDVDSDNDVGETNNKGGGSDVYSTGRVQEDRGSKRYHGEHSHRRSVDNHEDSRMGPHEPI